MQKRLSFVPSGQNVTCVFASELNDICLSFNSLIQHIPNSKSLLNSRDVFLNGTDLYFSKVDKNLLTIDKHILMLLIDTTVCSW